MKRKESLNISTNKKPSSVLAVRVLLYQSVALYKIGHRPTLPPFTAVPSALAGLTSLFGMGRGGHRRYRHLKILTRWLDD